MPTRKVTSGGDEIVPHDVVTKGTSEEPAEEPEPSTALGAEGFYQVNHRTVSEP